MPLPAAGSAWPPPALKPALDRIEMWGAWYGGDPDELSRVYGGTSTSYARPSEQRPGLIQRVARYFWSRGASHSGPRPIKLHVPLAGDMAATSADLLFSEPVILESEDQATQDRLDVLANELHARLLEAAEVCAGLGGVYLRTVWDADAQPDGPILSAVHADAAIPEWSYGELRAVTFWRELRRDAGKVWRHLERHDVDRGVGYIEHALFEGDPNNLGRAVPLADDTATAGFDVDELGRIPTGIPFLTAQYVPNMRPNRLWRSDPAAVHLGRSDYAGVESLMDALDETWSSWMRDLRLAKARIMVPQSMLTSHGPGAGASFDLDQELFVGLTALQSPNDSFASVVSPQQFAIRVEEHARTASELVSRIISAAGYSGQTFGLAGDVAMTATEAAARERKSLITRDKKGLYWRPALARITQAMLALGNEHFSWGVDVSERPSVRLPDAVQPTQRELAETVLALKTAESASVETRVRMFHTDWDDDQVKAEVDRILAEQSLTDPTTFDPGGDPDVPPDADPEEQP